MFYECIASYAGQISPIRDHVICMTPPLWPYSVHPFSSSTGFSIVVGEERNNLWNIDFDNYRFVALLF